jgi:hypothetical protein
MVLPLGQAYHVQRKLAGLKCQLQAARGAHRAPSHDLAPVKPAQPAAQGLNGISFGPG